MSGNPPPAQGSAYDPWDSDDLDASVSEPPPNGQPKETMILIMGGTGAGKSSFIKLLTGDKSIKIGIGIDPETSNIGTYKFFRPDGSSVILVDTPGFDDNRPHMTDTQLLSTLSKFMLKEHKRKTVNALIYLHRISDVRLGRTALRNIKMFSKLCGPDAMNNVVLLTTRWDEIKPDVAQPREKELDEKYFWEFRSGGAKLLRHYNTKESAHKVIDSILDIPPIEHVILVEELLRGARLADTGAGQELKDQINELKAQHEEEIKALKKQFEDAIKERDDEMKRELKRERDELRMRIEALEREKHELELNNIKEKLEEARRARDEALQKQRDQEKAHEEAHGGHRPHNEAPPLFWCSTCRTYHRTVN